MNDLLLLILRSVYFMFPAYIANAVPVFMSRLKFLDIPIDFNKKLNNKPILGRNKTVRGFFFGILFSILFVYIQKYLYGIEFFKMISIVDYNSINLLLLGFLLGFGVLFGDSFKSFIKRRLNKEPGSKFFSMGSV